MMDSSFHRDIMRLIAFLLEGKVGAVEADFHSENLLGKAWKLSG